MTTRTTLTVTPSTRAWRQTVLLLKRLTDSPRSKRKQVKDECVVILPAYPWAAINDALVTVRYARRQEEVEDMGNIWES